MIFNPEVHKMGSLCKRGHDYQGSGLSVRLKSDDKCVVCKSDEYREWREANLEKSRENSRQWKKANPEKVREKNSKWKKANPEKEREGNRKWAKANPEKVREKNRQQYQANAENVRERSRKQYQANAENVRERSRKYQKANAEKVRDGNRLQVSNITDAYVKHRIKDQYDIPTEEITPEVIAIKREQLKFKRLILNIKKEIKNGND